MKEKLFFIILVFFSCAGKEKLETIPSGPLPPSWTTLKRTLKPVLPARPLTPEEIEGNEEFIGKFEYGEGEDHLLREDLIKKGEAGKRRSLLYFVHISDVHVSDEESPLRAESAIYELSQRYSIQILDAMIRTLNDFSEERQFDFLIFTGDSTNSSQLNETRWFIDVLDGKEIDPDSGIDDDALPGPYNDFNDPFLAHGLRPGIPWFVTLGNHDCLILGTIWPSKGCSLLSGLGSEMVTGDRVCGVKGLCGAQDGSSVEMKLIGAGEFTPPDGMRRILGCEGFMEEFFRTPSSPRGHGFKEENLKKGKGSYAVDIGDVFRLIVLDTICREEILCGALSSGCIERSEFEGFLLPELERAQNDRRLVIVAFHHFFGSFFPYSPVKEKELEEALLSYPNVFLVLVGHGHDSRIIPHRGEKGGFWEIETGGLTSYPQQARIIEVVDNGNGTGSIYTTMVDHNSPDGSLSALGREAALREIQEAGKMQGEIGAVLFGTPSHYGERRDRNTELLFRIPEDIQKKMDNLLFPERIESLTTLKK